MQFVLFFVCLSLSVIILRLSHVFAYISSSLLSSSPLYGYSTFALFCFWFLAVMDKAAMNICVHVFVWTYTSMPPGELRTEWLGHVVNMFNFHRNCQAVF